MILNLETFDLANPSSNKVKLGALLSLLSKSGELGFNVRGRDIPQVRSLLQSCCGKNAKSLEVKIQKIPKSNLIESPGQKVVVASCTQPLPAQYMALASNVLDISIGLGDTVYGDCFNYDLMPVPMQSCMLTCGRHLEHEDYKRWRFIKAFEDQLKYKDYINLASSEPGKHFDRNLQKLPFVAPSKWDETWIEDTGKGRGHDALFMPGLVEGSVEHYYLIYLALKAAYKVKRYTKESLRNGFVLNLKTMIGAAAGHKTDRIMLYYTSSNAVHIRPYEHDNRDDYVLTVPYVPEKHIYDVI